MAFVDEASGSTQTKHLSVMQTRVDNTVSLLVDNKMVLALRKSKLIITCIHREDCPG